MNPPLPRPLVLGSTSRYRRELLSRLNLPFDVPPRKSMKPSRPRAPAPLAFGLHWPKRGRSQHSWPTAVVIGSDQVADLAGTPWASWQP